MAALRVALAQIDPTVGDVPGNADRVIARIAPAKALGAGLLVCPELVLSGYPPEDLLFHRGFRRRVDQARGRLAAAAQGIDLLVGCPEYAGGTIYNTAAWLRNGAVIARYRKQSLPNFLVFDEKPYFTAGAETVTVELAGIRIGLLICEDIWHVAPAAEARKAGAEFCIAINASPYQQGRQAQRETELGKRARENRIPFLYVNLVGGQDELVFDGNSFAVDDDGRVVHRAPAWDES